MMGRQRCGMMGSSAAGAAQAGPGQRSVAAAQAERGRTSKRRADSETPIDSSKSRAPASSRSASLCTQGGIGAHRACATLEQQHQQGAPLNGHQGSGTACRQRGNPTSQAALHVGRTPQAALGQWQHPHGALHSPPQPTTLHCAPACWLRAASSTQAGPQPLPAPSPPPPAPSKQAGLANRWDVHQ